jgi:hypothetical protein
VLLLRIQPLVAVVAVVLCIYLLPLFRQASSALPQAPGVVARFLFLKPQDGQEEELAAGAVGAVEMEMILELAIFRSQVLRQPLD